MAGKRNVFVRLLSLITYRKPESKKEFYIPEADVVETHTEDHPGFDSGEGKESAESSASQDESGDKGLKKPIPAKDFKKEKRKAAGNIHGKTGKKPAALSKDIKSNIEFIRQKFNYPDNKDIIIREFTIAGKHKAFIVYLEGMVDRTTVNNFILRPLLRDDRLKDIDGGCPLDIILESVLETNQTKKVTDPEEVVSEILIGDTGLYVDGYDFYIFSETKGFEKRSVEKPQIEGVVRGAQEGFCENLRTNITLIRRIIKNSNLTTEFIKIGKRNNNLCAVMYIKGLVNPAIVKEVKRRIGSLDADFIYGDGILEQFIEDNPWSLIPTTLSTERPDRAASHIIEGRVAIIAEGTPFAIIVPITLHSLFHSPEDFNLRWQYGTLLRYVRIIAAIMATLLPGLYVALTTYHREMIPTDLLIAIAKAKENVPFPTILELLLMEISFELIREAGIRIPGIIGNTLGIIGALILGQSAVQANIVSPILIIIVAVTGLGNFAIPNFNLAFGARIIRFLFIFAGASMGFYGISLLLTALVALASNMKSFGVPFLSITAPVTRKGHDALMRWPLWKQEKRPDYLNPLDSSRQPEVSRKWTEEDPEPAYDREENDD